MQIHPSNWDALLLQPHITQYRFTVNGSVMAADFIQGVPTIEKPMMLEPVIGRCCTGSLTIDIRQGDSGRSLKRPLWLLTAGYRPMTRRSHPTGSRRAGSSSHSAPVTEIWSR